jgi:hypothetical protein
MFEVELEDGRHLHAYKHWWTRRYIHLTSKARAFVYEEPYHYREANRVWLLHLVLPSGEDLVNFHHCLERARQDSNLWPIAPEAIALSS